ncbi:MAG: hypothetical protein H7246_20610 [Phycisphaerae bacterium]|nr:hypothetical protein [Saprospiraceae bacterium]
MNLKPEVDSLYSELGQLKSLVTLELHQLKMLLGKELANQVKSHGIYEDIHGAEFKVFSQFGDDGILQYLIHETRPEQRTFIEFGVEDYREANTRFLLMNDNWRGLIIDGSHEAMEAVRRDVLHWRFDLTAVGAFITRENINQLFSENGFRGEIGLLSIDIDGNDYWIWEQIDVVQPVIVTIEYNSVFGSQHAVTIPYDPAFFRTSAHYSNLYWGASLRALCLLAEKKGYAFVGSNSNGNNAHFVRKERLGRIPALSPEKGYVESKYRESRDQQGNLTYLGGMHRLNEIKDMQVYDVEKAGLVRLGDLSGL